MKSQNPATGEILATFETHSDAHVQRALQRAANAFVAYRITSFRDRTRWMTAAAQIIEDEKQQFARTMTLEMGKPIAAAVAEAEKCAWACRYYADNAERFLAEDAVDTGDRASSIRYLPIGPVLAIMPWNFPFWQAFRFIAPALMAGNVALLKHASNVPQCALAIEDILRRAGFPDGVFQALMIGSDAVDAIIRDPRIRAVTLTGSEGAGSAVGRTAGEVLKKSVLELGGSDPFVVMESADLDAAVKTAVQARTINNGQSCIAAKRFIVHAPVYDRFRDAFVEAMQALRVGDPMDEDTQVGPLATETLRDELHEQVQQTLAAGATLLTGGDIPQRDGWYYEPTVLEAIPEGSPAHNDELFGPVASLFRARDLDDAVRIANETPFGLGSSAWTTDPDEQERFIRDLDAGLVFINGMVASDPRLPFGGVKRSGYGRELSRAGILEFVNTKTVVIEKSSADTKQAE